jgi:hypothetical protein
MKLHFARPFALGILSSCIIVLAQTGNIWSQKPPVPVVPNPQAPNLKPVVPLGMQRGTTLDVTLTGANLADPTGLWTTFPAKFTFPPEGNNGKDPAKLVVRLEVPKDAPMGFHALRLSTAKGMSNIRLFCIDDLPQVLQGPNNRTRQTAQEVPVPCVVVGRVTAEANDYYKFKAAANQRISFEVLGRRLGSAFDPSITLFDARTGKDLPDGQSLDAPGLQTDSRCTYTFKEAGEYLLEIRDVSYRGGEDFNYRLRIGDFPCATTPLPMAIKRGTKASVQFAGPNVEGVAPVDVQAPTDPQTQALWVAPRGASGLYGWPVSLAVSDLDEILEQEPNDEPAKANRVPVPGAVTGRIQAKGDVDHFVFAAKKGQRYIIEAHTTDLHSPAEVLLTLLDAKAAQIAASNPAAAARIDYTATADGDLTLKVEHLYSWGGPDQSYRVTITPYEPGFDLTIGLDRFDIAPGGTLSLQILTTRRDYPGPIEVTVVGPAGLTGKATIPAGQPPQPGQVGTTLTVTAAPTLASGPYTFTIVGSAAIGGKTVVSAATLRNLISQNLAALPVPPRTLYHDIGLAVTEKPPFTLAAKFDAPMTAPGAAAMLTVTATRLPGFTGEIALSVTGLPANVALVPKNIAMGQNEVKLQINAAANAAMGTFPLTVTGKAKHNNRDYTVNAAPVPLVLKK